MHNGYFYPQDVKITTVNGIRTAMVDFTLPTMWTDAAITLAKSCFVSGWELARREFEKNQMDTWLAATYPNYYREKLAFSQAHKQGYSISAIRALHKGVQTIRAEIDK